MILNVHKYKPSSDQISDFVMKSKASIVSSFVPMKTTEVGNFFFPKTQQMFIFAMVEEHK
jgi:hypothetical protein